MPSQEPSKSPSRRPPLSERVSSSNSVHKGSPKGGNILNAHRGSSTRLHKHTVGHSRPGHARINSHGKGLNKLSKLYQENLVEQDDETPQDKRSTSHTPSTSPHSLSSKRNSSAVSLSRPPLKSIGRRNVSHPNLGRNGNIIRLGNQQKSDKAQLKRNLLKKEVQEIQDEPVRGTIQFELGDDTYEDEWTDSGSQSPVTTRTHSRPKTPASPTPKELPLPDEPPERFRPDLPHSPSDSPKPTRSHAPRYSHPPDARAVTSRLLSGNAAHVTPPQASNISARVIPHRIGSPSLGQGSGSSHDPSLPADGVSRFLSGSTTPGSGPHLADNFSNAQDVKGERSRSDAIAKKIDARRVKSAVDLSHVQLSAEQPPSTPSSPSQENVTSGHSRKPFNPSPFESARGANPSAGKSYTQLKMNLDRQATYREPLQSNHPLVTTSGSMLNLAGAISTNPGDLEQRLKRQYLEARKDVQACRRYYPDIITGKIPEVAVKSHQQKKRSKGREKKSTTTSAAGSADSQSRVLGSSADGKRNGVDGKRGRVRFESTDPDQSSQRWRTDSAISDDDGIDALLRRIWLAPEPTDVSEGE